MKRYVMVALLTLALCGVATAQGPPGVANLLNNVGNTVNGLVSGLQDTGTAALSGNVEGTVQDLTGTLTGLGVNLTDNTPLAQLGLIGQQLGDRLVVAGQPLYNVLQGPTSALTGLAAPLTAPLIQTLNGLDLNLNLNAIGSQQPGLGGVLSLSISLPGLDGLPLSGLDGGGSQTLPGLGGLPGLGSRVLTGSSP